MENRGCMAIDSYEFMESLEVKPEDFFALGTADIEKVGEIQITGAIEFLDSYFSVKS